VTGKPVNDKKIGNDRFWLRLNWFVIFMGAYGSAMNYCGLYDLSVSNKEHVIMIAYSLGFASVIYLFVDFFVGVCSVHALKSKYDCFYLFYFPL
jgi:hypothetical protein